MRAMDFAFRQMAIPDEPTLICQNGDRNRVRNFCEWSLPVGESDACDLHNCSKGQSIPVPKVCWWAVKS